MPNNIDKNELLELEILKHVEETPMLNNRMAASKLGCSVKLAHALLSKMVDRGLLHVKKLHSRRWDYFLTPHGIAEKARLTYEFLDFSMQFYHEARKKSSIVCRQLAETGHKTVAFIGAGDLAEIVYLGVKEWGLELIEVFNGDTVKAFLGHPVLPRSELPNSQADAIIVCLYERNNPMTINYLPDDITRVDNMYWVFDENKEKNEFQINTEPIKKYIQKENLSLTAAERMAKFEVLQQSAFDNMSPEGFKRFTRRNMKKRAVAIKTEVNEENKVIVKDNYNAKYGLWAKNGKVATMPKMILPVTFRPQKFGSYQEMNEWKKNLLVEIAKKGGVTWSR